MQRSKVKNLFFQGAIPPTWIAEQIAKHSSQTGIGAHSIFLGQVRSDEKDGKRISAIEYTAYEAMALEKMAVIREHIFSTHPITCLHAYHSLGRIEAGQICFFVFASAPHRKLAIEACEETVEKIKAELPIWGKEYFGDESYQWKVNV